MNLVSTVGKTSPFSRKKSALPRGSADFCTLSPAFTWCIRALTDQTGGRKKKYSAGGHCSHFLTCASLLVKIDIPPTEDAERSWQHLWWLLCELDNQTGAVGHCSHSDDSWLVSTNQNWYSVSILTGHESPTDRSQQQQWTHPPSYERSEFPAWCGDAWCTVASLCTCSSYTMKKTHQQSVNLRVILVTVTWRLGIQNMCLVIKMMMLAAVSWVITISVLLQHDFVHCALSNELGINGRQSTTFLHNKVSYNTDHCFHLTHLGLDWLNRWQKKRVWCRWPLLPLSGNRWLLASQLDWYTMYQPLQLRDHSSIVICDDYVNLTIKQVQVAMAHSDDRWLVTSQNCWVTILTGRHHESPTNKSQQHLWTPPTVLQTLCNCSFPRWCGDAWCTAAVASLCTCSSYTMK